MSAVTRDAMVRGALTTVATLFGGLVAGVAIGNLVFSLLPGSSVMAPRPLHAIIAAIPTALALAAGAAVWGVRMGKVTAYADRRRMAVAGMLGFVPITLILAFSLLGLERLLVERFGDWLPIHRAFTLLFVPTAFLIAGVGGWALGRGLGDRSLSRRLSWTAGLSAGVAFLIVNLMFEAAGWVVGAPGAGERATMLVVMFSADLAAALAAGAAVGYGLQRTQQPNTVR